MFVGWKVLAAVQWALESYVFLLHDWYSTFYSSSSTLVSTRGCITIEQEFFRVCVNVLGVVIVLNKRLKQFGTFTTIWWRHTYDWHDCSSLYLQFIHNIFCLTKVGNNVVALCLRSIGFKNSPAPPKHTEITIDKSAIRRQSPVTSPLCAQSILWHAATEPTHCASFLFD